MSGGGQSPVSALSAALAELPHLPRTQLVDLWTKHIGRPPPKSASSPLLLRAVAYALQQQQLGGLKRQELRLLHKAIETGGIKTNGQKSLNSKMREGATPAPNIGELRSMQRALTSPTEDLPRVRIPACGVHFAFPRPAQPVYEDARRWIPPPESRARFSQRKAHQNAVSLRAVLVGYGD